MPNSLNLFSGTNALDELRKPNLDWIWATISKQAADFTLSLQQVGIENKFLLQKPLPPAAPQRPRREWLFHWIEKETTRDRTVQCNRFQSEVNLPKTLEEVLSGCIQLKHLKPSLFGFGNFRLREIAFVDRLPPDSARVFVYTCSDRIPAGFMTFYICLSPTSVGR